MKFWVTKYSLSSGKVMTVDAEIKVWSDGARFIWLGFTSYTLGKDAFDTEAAAMADVEVRRVKKIESLEKQIAKLQKQEFAITETAA